MRGLLAAESRKLTSVRTVWVLSLIGWAFTALGAATPFMAESMVGTFTGSAEQVAMVVDGIGQSSIFVLVVGLLSMTTEFRHGTAGRTLLVTPSRLRVLLAKMAGGIAYVVAFVLVGLAVVAVVLLIGAATRGVGLELDAEVARSVGEAGLGLSLTVLLGVALGAAVRSQVVAITVSLAWVFVLENLLAFWVPDVGRWLPFQALQSVFAPPGGEAGPVTALEPAIGLLTFLGYVVAALAVAVVLMSRRDV